MTWIGRLGYGDGSESTKEGKRNVSEIEKLLQVQELDVQLKEMERELTDIPARKQEEEDRLKNHKAALAEAQEGLKRLQAELRENENEGGSLEEKIAKLRTQQMQLKTNKEFKAMEMEIDAVKAQITRLEDGELELMEQIEVAQADVAQRGSDLKEEEAAVQEDIKVLDERIAGIECDVAALRERRQSMTEPVNPEWLQQYERLNTRRNPAMVAVNDGICGGCHLQLPPYIINDTKKADLLVACPFCGRIVY